MILESPTKRPVRIDFFAEPRKKNFMIPVGHHIPFEKLDTQQQSHLI